MFDAVVDCASAGIAIYRGATTKSDFVTDERQHDLSGPKFPAFIIVVKSYDCGKRLLHEESTEIHNSDGSTLPVHTSNDPTWLPAPQVKAADPTFDFVCEWRPR